jgi:hypothetical protein
VVIREYLQTELSQTLEVGKEYEVSFYIYLAEASSYGTNNIGAYLSDIAISKSASELHNFSCCSPQIEFTDTAVTDTAKWVHIKGTFKVLGNEKFLTIGNFRDSIPIRKFNYISPLQMLRNRCVAFMT